MRVQEAPGWSRQGNGADSWNSVEFESLKVLREAEKPYVAQKWGDREKIVFRSEWTCAECAQPSEACQTAEKSLY